MCHILYSTCKWYLFIFSVLLTSLSVIIFRSFHVAANGIIAFVFMAEEHCILYMYHVFFIHSSDNRNFWLFFYVLAIVNRAAMNIKVHVSFWARICLDKCPGVGLVDHMVILFLVFWGISILFSTVAAPTYISTNGVGGFPKTKPYFKLWICYLTFHTHTKIN